MFKFNTTFNLINNNSSTFIGEFANVRVSDGMISSLTGSLRKNRSTKIKGFTNKQFAKAMRNSLKGEVDIKYDYPRGFSPKRIVRENKTNLNKYDYAALKSHMEKQWSLPHQINKLNEALIDDGQTPLDIKAANKLNRMGRVKTAVALGKLNVKNNPNNSKVLTRYLTVPNKDLPAFLQSYDPNAKKINNNYSVTENGKIRFKNNLSTTSDDKTSMIYGMQGADAFSKHNAKDSTRIRYMIKSKKNSRGKDISSLDKYSNEKETLFPSNTRYKLKHIKSSPFETTTGMPQYNIRLDEI